MPKIEGRYLWNDGRLALSASMEGDRLYLEVNQRPVSFSIVPGAVGSFVLQDEDRVLAGYAVATADEVWVELDGRTYVLERDRPRPRSAVMAAASGEILSPMTGTVRKVFIEPEQMVADGAPLLVVEAMKMEFNVTAPLAGRVAELLCAVGQSVDLGQRLVRIDPAPGQDGPDGAAGPGDGLIPPA